MSVFQDAGGSDCQCEFPFRGGEMGARIRAHDWSTTCLGPISGWPPHLKSALSLILSAKAQIVLFWGPEYLAFYNDAYAPTIGGKHPAALGRPANENWRELWDDLEPLLAKVRWTGETNEASDRPFYIERYGYPETVYFDISYSPIYSDAGQVDGVLCIVKETTDRIHAERALAKSEERLTNALSAAGIVGIFDTDLVDGKVYADARFAEMYSVDPGIAEQGAPLDSYMNNVHPEDKEWVEKAIYEAVETGKKCVLEYRVVSTGGAVRWLEVHGHCLYDESGKPWRMPGLAVDITDRKRAELAVGRLAAIVASSEDAIIGTDLNGVITSWNRGAEKLYGYSSNEAIGKPVTILLPDDRRDEEQCILDRVERGEHVEPYDTFRLRKDGSVVDVSLTVSPVSDSQGRIMGASKIARDITSRRESEQLRHTLMNEIRHRMQNSLATVLAIARQTFRNVEGAEEACKTFEARLMALSKGHTLLTAESWNSVALNDIVAQPLAAFGADRFEIDGPDTSLSPRATLGLTLVLHELATNAAKYGALSDPSGIVKIKWVLEDSEPKRLSLRWRETGGPPVTPPSHKGFGSSLITSALLAETDSQTSINYDPAGVICEVSLPVNSGSPD